MYAFHPSRRIALGEAGDEQRCDSRPQLACPCLVWCCFAPLVSLSLPWRLDLALELALEYYLEVVVVGITITLRLFGLTITDGILAYFFAFLQVS